MHVVFFAISAWYGHMVLRKKMFSFTYRKHGKNDLPILISTFVSNIQYGWKNMQEGQIECKYFTFQAKQMIMLSDKVLHESLQFFDHCEGILNNALFVLFYLLYYAKLYYISLYCTILHYVILYYFIFHYITSYHIMLHHICYITLYCIIFYFIIPYYFSLFYIMSYYTVFY